MNTAGPEFPDKGTEEVVCENEQEAGKNEVAVGEAWAITDDDLMTCMTQDNWLFNYLAYGYDCTDAPLAYHMATGLSVLSMAVASRCEVVCYDTTAGISRVQREPLNVWSMLVGDSGDRKSQAMNLGLDILHDRMPNVILPSDGSIEAWHDTLAGDDYSGLGLLHRDELAFMLDQSRRGYSEGMRSWLLQLYSGQTTKRVTKADGVKTIYRPRVSILGAIPSDVLSRKMGPEDWQSGFAARFMIWTCRRQRYMPKFGRIAHLHDALGTWLTDVALASQGDVVYRDGHESLIQDWSYQNVELKRRQLPGGLFSSLTRLAQHAFRMAALIEIAKLRQPFHGELPISRQSVCSAVALVDLLRLSLLKMFGMVVVKGEVEEENEVMRILAEAPNGLEPRVMAKMLGLSNAKVYRILQTMSGLSLVTSHEKPNYTKPGPKPRVYKLV